MPAFAQNATENEAPAQDVADADDIEQVIVTGTRTKNRSVLESAAPVDVLSARDLEAADSINGELGQALQTLLPSFNFPRQSNSGGADHVRAAQLRGLSPDQVLVNGKRRHTSALVNDSSKIGRGTATVDFNSIPLNAIKRIEVLRDDAGAQYGSDAIAGVINVILDDAADGGELLGIAVLVVGAALLRLFYALRPSMRSHCPTKAESRRWHRLFRLRLLGRFGFGRLL